MLSFPLPFSRKTIETMCTVIVKHTDETLEAHVELDNQLLPSTGDRITVYGAPIRVDYGNTIKIRREARLVRGIWADKIWLRVRSFFEMTELYEVSFSPRSL